MSVANEYITGEKLKRYDLESLRTAHHLPPIGGLPDIEDWTIDHGRHAFLIEIWGRQTTGFSGYAFHWKGTWCFFDMCSTSSRIDSLSRSCWFKFLVKGLFTLGHAPLTEELLSDLKEAITALPGGVPLNFLKHSAEIEFLDEKLSKMGGSKP
ncbi:hypothetical protein [Hydrogenophaga sp. BPS33]|uniref:hypothetical protein n=1 Tax=Hydrogenophaga sp. BPS33 TaxID=2651974 RepID=UPI00132043FF|nr:hypothetical protein [Hydrogenophaga sp. BPS33]QHE85155.1 hypothetical protein F9K07_09785 [Hydrogenophaga sp. BPS33]